MKMKINNRNNIVQEILLPPTQTFLTKEIAFVSLSFNSALFFTLLYFTLVSHSFRFYFFMFYDYFLCFFIYFISYSLHFIDCVKELSKAKKRNKNEKSILQVSLITTKRWNNNNNNKSKNKKKHNDEKLKENYKVILFRWCSQNKKKYNI